MDGAETEAEQMSWERLNVLEQQGKAEIIQKVASPFITNITYKVENHHYTVNIYHDWCSDRIDKYEIIG
ncbi:MAG TPA: hypothetical protein VHR47_05205 [Bacillota bacterium]|nr:hypothetical protein [Bacillota bacterium]